MSTEAENCQIVEVDGEPVRVQGNVGDWDDADREAFAEIVRAAKAKYAAEHSPDVPRCGMCRRRRDPLNPDRPMDGYDYSAIQVITGRPLGWYSGDDGEVCPECITRTLANQ